MTQDIKQWIKDANNLINATVRRICVIEPESPKWACDVDALRDLIKELTEREEKLANSLNSLVQAIKDARANAFGIQFSNPFIDKAEAVLSDLGINPTNGDV